MTPLVEVRLKGLARRLEQRRGIPEKRNADVMWTGRHGHANLEVFVEQRIVAIGGLWTVGAAVATDIRNFRREFSSGRRTVRVSST